MSNRQPTASFAGRTFEGVVHVEVHERGASPGAASIAGVPQVEGRLRVVQVSIFCRLDASNSKPSSAEQGRLQVEAPDESGTWRSLDLDPVVFHSAVRRSFGPARDALAQFAFRGTETAAPEKN